MTGDPLNGINIVTVCDNNYVMLLATLLKSIEVNNCQRRNIHFFVVGENISAKNKSKVEKSVSSGSIDLHWLDIKKVIPRGVRLPTDKSTYPLNIYARLFIPHFIPTHIEKVIYMDVDMIVLTNISKLWDIDLGGKAIGAVHEPTATFADGVKNYSELGFSSDLEYFNSGLLLIDTAKWRTRSIADKVLKCVEDNPSYAKYPDQYGLNVVFANDWTKISYKWNVFANVEESDPYIIHFIGYKPIYADYVGMEVYFNKFYYYMKQTEWSNYTPKAKYTRLLIKLKTKIKKGWYRFSRTLLPEI